MKIANGARKVGGFSLIELLVVISVTSLLAGLLFPVFCATRSKGRQCQCASNLKQIGVAFDLYAQDWNGYFPCPGGRYGDLSYWDQEGDGGIRPYLDDNKRPDGLLCCPGYTGNWNSRWSPRTYSMNEYLRTPPDILYPKNTAYLCGIAKRRIPYPGRTILLYEGIPADSENPYGEGFVYRCGNWEWVAGYLPSKMRYWQKASKPMHGQFNNYLMCDGHVVTRIPERYPFAPTSPSNNAWFVNKLR